VSPSKKANKQVVNKNSKSAQGITKKTPARSSRIAPKRQGKTRKSLKPKNASMPVEAALPVESTAPVQEQAEAKQPVPSLITTMIRVVVLMTVAGVTFYIYSIRDHVEDFEQFGYAGIFLIALMANATILLPAPGVAIIYAMGAVFNPIGVGLAAGTGGALGELSGYLAGYSGQAIIGRPDVYNRFKPWVDKYGGWAILVLSAIPNPFFDIAGIAAGIARMPIQTFLLFTWIGQVIKMTTFALAGHYSLEWLTNFMS
jgi:membrane protein DedA with SNARE-associated domain